MNRHSLVVLLLAASGCQSLPWGEGGAEPTRSSARALVRTLDHAVLAAASERLAATVTADWAAGARLDSQASPLIDWRSLVLVPGSPRLELMPEGPIAYADHNVSTASFGLVAQVPFAGAEHEIYLSGDALAVSCPVRIVVAAGELEVPLGLAADKLGRVQGVVLPGATYQALSDVAPNAILDADFSACFDRADQFEPGAQLAALDKAFAASASRAVADALSARLPGALGLDLAFAWSAAVNPDAIGTGFVRTALRALTGEVVERRDDALQVAYALSIEADPHPCVGPLELATPRPSFATPALPGGAALHLSALERAVVATWITGGVCADHLGRVTVPVTELSHAWPALAELGEGAEVSLELWPTTSPRISLADDLADGLLVETGRMRADILVTFADARWRAATAEIELAVSGAIFVEADGRVSFEPAHIDPRALNVEGVLFEAPTAEAIDMMIAPLVEALLLARPLARLPPALAPPDGAWATMSGDYLSWPAL